MKSYYVSIGIEQLCEKPEEAAAMSLQELRRLIIDCPNLVVEDLESGEEEFVHIEEEPQDGINQVIAIVAELQDEVNNPISLYVRDERFWFDATRNGRRYRGSTGCLVGQREVAESVAKQKLAQLIEDNSD